MIINLSNKLRSANARLAQIPDYDPVAKEHYWAMILTFKVNPEKVDLEGTAFLDHENLVSVAGVCCYYCQRLFSPEIAKMRCYYAH
jgi:hypothetical protein